MIRPIDAIHKRIDKTVIVFTNNGVMVKGILAGYDIHMNLVIRNGELIRDGKTSSFDGVARGSEITAIQFP